MNDEIYQRTDGNNGNIWLHRRADDGEADLGAIGEEWPMQHREEAEADTALIVELVNNLPEIILALKAKDATS